MPHLPDPVTVTLEYTDADGIETRRKVDVYRTAKKAGYSTITGWCHGRQAERTFRSDRVESVIDEYGEVFSASEFLGKITADRAQDVGMSPIANTNSSVDNLGRQPEPNKLKGWLITFYWGLAFIHTAFIWYEIGIEGALMTILLYWAIGWAISKWWNREKR